MPGHMIRALTSDDFDTWWTLRVRAFADHPEAFAQNLDDMLAEGRHVTRKRFETERIASDNRIFGAFTPDGSLVGMATVDRSERRKMRHQMEIQGVYVVPKARGRGIGEL